MRVRNLMKQPVIAAGPDQTLREAARLMHERHIRHLIVQDQDEVLGMLSLRDVLSVFLPEHVHG